MTTPDLLQDLVLAGWRFWIEDGKLRYRAPKKDVSDALLQDLRARKEDVLELLRTAPESLEIAPVSHGQRALWFLWLLAPDSTAYNQSLPLSLPSGSSADTWRRACEILTARHPMLRTSFPGRQGAPIQHIAPAVSLDWEPVQAGAMSETALASSLEAAHARPFDLEARPPVRFRWFGGRGDRDILLITMHHVACDGWSMEIVRRELGWIAATLSAGEAWTEPPPRHDYAEFARWQHELLAGPEGDRLWEFWQQHLAPPLAQLDLPTDRPRPAIQTYNGDSVRFEIDAALSTRLRTLAVAEGVTQYHLLLAAFLVLLSRWTRQEDLVIGTPTAGRSRPEFSGIVGYFVDPVVIRARAVEGQPFRAFLAAVRHSALQSMAHRDFPFPLLVQKLRVDRDPARSPIFDATFNFLSRRAADPSGEAGAPSTVDIRQADGKFELTLTVIEDEHAMSAALGYNSDLFERATIERIGGYLRCVLEAICDDPDAAIDAIPLQGGERVQPVLTGAPLDLSRLCPVHEIVAERAKADPAAIAVIADDATLSYGQLAERAAALAARLREWQVGADVPVGLHTGRTSAYVTGLLGILEAGGAYVPVEPSHPPGVISSMLEQAGATIVVTTRPLVGSLPAGARTIVLEDVAPFRGRTEPARAGLSDLAYVIFTSGSTGTPKGVAIEHRALANYVASIISEFAIADRSSFAFVSSVGADLGNTALFPCLCAGGTLHVLSEEVATNPRAFAEYLSAHEVDYLKIVPSHFAALGGDALPRTALIFGGESSSSDWVARLRDSGCAVFNHYGPTETTIGVMTHCARARETAASLPLSRAVANTSILLLDEQRRSVAPGMPGEIYIAGACLARGYIGDPARTRERFVDLPGIGRAYRTGDLARQLSDGSLQVLGRNDRQVKVRGYRIELGQVESVLLTHPAVRQAAALPDADGAAASTVLAWVVLDQRHAATPAGLRDFARARLPSYMVPAQIACVDRMPLTGNGKLDVRALRAIAAHLSMAESMPGHARMADARDLVELRLARLWSSVLGVTDVGPDDDFFERGGHSLLAVRLAGMIFDEFQQRLSLATFFTNRTLAQLAAVVRSSSTAAPSIAVRLQPHGAYPPLVCLPGAGGNIMYFQGLVRALGDEFPVWGLQAPGLMDGSHAPSRVEDLAAEYVGVLRRTIQPDGPYHLAGHSFGALVAYEMARQLRAAGEPVAFVGILDQAAPGSGAESYDGWTRQDWLRHVAMRIERLYGVDLGLQDDGWPKGDREGADRLVTRILESGLLPPDTNREYFSRYVDVYQAHAIAAATYRPPVLPIDVRLTVLRAATADRALGGAANVADPTLGWSPFTALPVQVLDIPGTHITMLLEPAVTALAASLRAALASARARSADSAVQAS